MNFFRSGSTVDGKARGVLSDLPEDPSPYEILRTVDQKAGEDVDPDEVVSKIRDLDDEVDTKLAEAEGDGVDQKDMRAAAGTLAERSDLSHDDAMELFSAAARGDVDQAALTDLTNSQNMGNEPDSPENSGTDTPDAGDADVDQKQEDDQMNPIDLVEEIGGSDARDTVEDYAESVNKDPQDAAAEWVAENVPGVTVEGYGNDGGSSGEPAGDAAPAPDQNGGGHDRQAQPAVDQMGDTDQKLTLEDLNLNERIAEAVTSDQVLDKMAGEVAQKMASDDEFADNLVETVDQKGDFVTTDDTVVTAPGNESETVSEAGAITGGDGGDNE